jgi:hypothetical protein
MRPSKNRERLGRGAVREWNMDDMEKKEISLRTGDWVEVKSALEILESLDSDGTLDGLPFMPEMMEYCARRFRVLRRAEKTCIEFSTGYRIREFLKNDVFVLDGLRCSGASHDGCQRACTIFWKASWLRRVKAGVAEQPVRQPDDEALRATMKTKSAPDRYFCQSTELGRATMALSRRRTLTKCFQEVRSGSRGILEMGWLILAPLWFKATKRLPRPKLKGSLKRTPLGDLKLQPGEWVTIRTAEEIAQTLDERGRNRGLSCDYGMCQFSGRKYRVRNRLDRMISESTGHMRQVDGTVLLENLNCICYYSVLGGCARQDFMYWREVWLQRAQPTVVDPVPQDTR